MARRTAHRISLAEADAARIEHSAGKPLAELTEAELLDSVRALGIRKLETNEE